MNGPVNPYVTSLMEKEPPWSPADRDFRDPGVIGVIESSEGRLSATAVFVNNQVAIPKPVPTLELVRSLTRQAEYYRFVRLCSGGQPAWHQDGEACRLEGGI